MRGRQESNYPIVIAAVLKTWSNQAPACAKNLKFLCLNLAMELQQVYLAAMAFLCHCSWIIVHLWIQCYFSTSRPRLLWLYITIYYWFNIVLNRIKNKKSNKVITLTSGPSNVFHPYTLLTSLKEQRRYYTDFWPIKSFILYTLLTSLTLFSQVSRFVKWKVRCSITIF